MDADDLAPQIRAALTALRHALAAREPAIRWRLETLREAHPRHTSQELAQELVRSTRRRVAATGALSGAAAIAPGIGTLLAVGTITSQTLYALEQEIELVLAIAMVYGHELVGTDDRVLEALVVVGLTSGALKLREEVIVAGGERLAVAAFRRLPALLLAHGSGRMVTRILSRFTTGSVSRLAGRIAPLGLGVAMGAGFDWLTVTGLGRVAISYYGPGGPGARPLLLAPENASDVELGS